MAHPRTSSLACSSPWFANRYPDPSVTALQERVVASHSVKTKQIVLGYGSGEILNTSAAASLGPGKKLTTALLTFEAIGRYAKVLGAEVSLYRFDLYLQSQ